MTSFRNRLLVLLIGLVVGAQTVTLITALASTSSTERRRADEELQQGLQIARQQLDYREKLLASTVDVLGKDYGLREAFALQEEATLASALGNAAGRIQADLVLALDLDGRLVAHGEGTTDADPALLAEINQGMQGGSSGAQFVMSRRGVYQVFAAPLKDDIGQVVLGFAVDSKLAEVLHRTVGRDVEVAFLAGSRTNPQVVASTLESLALGPSNISAPLANAPAEVTISGVEYLATSRPLTMGDSGLEIAVLKPMEKVRAPFYQLAKNIGLSLGITLAAAVIAGLYLGRSAAKPVQKLAEGAARVAAGDYSKSVEASGGKELENLAASFNSMQSGIAERESRLLHMARHDPVTGLPNRLHLEEALSQWLRHPSPPNIAVVQLAVTNLREISATLGYDIADSLVCHLARQLSIWNAERGLVARLDTAIFAVAIALPEPLQPDELAEQIRICSSRELATAGITLQATTVAGVAVAPLDAASPAEVLRCAQAATEAAHLQRSGVAMFAASSDVAQRRRLRLGADLPLAITSGQLRLLFQPKVSFADRSVRGVEALVRWEHPEFGLVSPAEFVPIAERTGASARLTRWVLQTALEQLAAWHRDGYRIEVSVNLSAADILDQSLLQFILESLRSVKVPAGALTLEITESVFMEDPEAVRRNMELLRLVGVRFSIDDFGTGYSSLSQLRELAADELKIDQSFVRGPLQGEEQVAVLRAIIELAHGLGLRTVAEGVETEEQWRMLAQLGCHHAQGYLISKPAMPAQLLPLLQVSRQAMGELEATQSNRVLELRRRET